MEDSMRMFEGRRYTCPDCETVCWKEDLEYRIASGILYVCPACGCIQDEREVERQLGMED